MDHEEIIERAAESIMQRANDTYPRTLHKDMLRDEIGKAVREATKRQNWPPAIAIGDLPGFLKPPYNVTVDNPSESVFVNIQAGTNGNDEIATTGDPITASHNEARKKLSERMIEHYYGKPE